MIPELTAALDAARKASIALVEEYARFEVIPDAPSSISTHADKLSQEIILRRLQEQFPDDAYAGEEATESLGKAAHTGQRLWIIDPIDGTRGFARKNGEFSVMIAFARAGQLEVGVVAEPTQGRLTYASRGQGCWRQDGEGKPQRCQVTHIQELGAATLTQSRSSRTPGPRSPVALLKPARIVQTYSAGIKLALVARGEADAYVNDYDAFSDWDIAAGQILVEEAGGQVTGLHGETLVYGLPGARQENGLVATNQLLHKETIRLLNS